MKKIISIVLLAALCLCLAACGSVPAAEPTATPTPEPTATPTPEPTATLEPEKDQTDLLKTFAATIEQSYAKTNMRATVNVEGNTIEMLLTLDGLNAAVAEMKTNGDYSTWNTMKESLSGTADSIRKTGEAIGLTDFVLKVTLYDDKTALPLVSWTDGEQTYDLVGD